MGNHFREPDTFVQFTPETRKRIEMAIEGLVGLLDQCDGDPNLEDDGTGEPLLATVQQQDALRAYHDAGDDRELDDEYDEDDGTAEYNGDDEPWLSAAAVGWGSYNDGGFDREEDYCGA